MMIYDTCAWINKTVIYDILMTQNMQSSVLGIVKYEGQQCHCFELQVKIEAEFRQESGY